MAKNYSDVLCPVEYGEGENKKTSWTRLGRAYDKGGGKWTIMLDALPLNGRLVIMPPKGEVQDEPF